MKKRNIAKIIILAVLVILAIVVGKLLTETSFGADNEESAILEGAFNKYVNYELGDGSKGTLVQYSIRTGIKYENDFFAIRNSELNVILNQIDGKYPYDVKVIAKSTKVTNGKTSDISEDYSYDANTGIVTIRTNNENENKEPIYNERTSENDRDEFVIIAYYDTFSQDKIERDLSCDVSYKAILFTEDNREVSTQGRLEQKVTEDVGELTSVTTNVSDIYNGYIKSNIINGTTYDTEYTENNEVMISKKEAHQKIEILEENTFVNLNDIYYKSTKILKDDILNVLGENGKIEILDANNNNVIATIDNNTEFNENGEFIVTYGEDVNNISIKTSDIINEGILRIENVKKIKSDVSNLDDKDLTRKLTVVGFNEKEVEVPNTETSVEQEPTNENTTLNIVTLNTNAGTLKLNTDNEQVSPEAENTPAEQPKEVQIVEEETYRTEKNDVYEVKDATTNVSVNIDNTNWTNEKQNDVIFDILLNSSSVANNLFNNPTIRIKLPTDVQKVVLGDSSILYSNGLNMEKPYVETLEDGSNVIVIKLNGKETAYTENNLDLKTDIKIPVSIILNKDIESRTDKFIVDYTNNYTVDGSSEAGSLEGQITIENFKVTQSEENTITGEENTENGLIDKVTEVVEEQAKQEIVQATQEEIDGLEVTVTPVDGDTELKDGDTLYEGEFIKYNIQIKNITSNNINDVRLVGTIPDGLKYGELVSKFDSFAEEERDYQYEFNEELTEKEINIGTIKAGQTITEYYEVQVEDLPEEETEKDITTNIKAYIGSTETFDYTINNKVKEAEAKAFLWSMVNGNYGQWVYGINLDNPSGEEVTIRLELPEFFEITQEIIDAGQTYVKAFDLEYSQGINVIDVINGGVGSLGGYTYTLEGREVVINTTETGMYMIGVQAGDEKKLQEEHINGQAELLAYATVSTNNNTYRTNENRINYGLNSASIEINSENAGEEVKYGEEINYNISITCTGVSGIKSETSGIYVNILDYLPENVKPISITYDFYERLTEPNEESAVAVGFSEKQTKTEGLGYTTTDEDGNALPSVNLYTWIPYQETVNIEVKTTAGYVYEKTEIENNALVQTPQFDILPGESEVSYNESIVTKTSNVVKHIILPYNYDEETEDPDTPEDPDDPDTPVEPDDPDIPSDPNATYDISGVAWNDVNGDGSRQSTEDLISGIDVLLVDLEDSSNVKAQATTNNGRYTFENLAQGSYIVVFRYNTSLYAITQYKASGVSDEINSDAMEQTITLDGRRVNVGVTDQITLNQDTNNVDIGLMEKGGYDLKLDKYITDVTVTTVNGTKQTSYNNTQLGRIEIRAKEIEGAEVSVKYKIVVTNEGKSAATVTEIYDYLPDGLSFSTTGNSNWTNEKGMLINRGLMNQTINPGESKEVTLTLTKTMTGENTGTFTNAAEIGNATGILEGMTDADSEPGNRDVSEDDYSTADLIIGVSTGLAVYISIGIIIAIVVILTILGIKFKFKIKKISKIGFSIILFAMVGIVSCKDVLAVQCVYTGNAVTTHGFVVYGGPTSTAECYNHGLPAAGENTSGVVCPESNTLYTYSYGDGYKKYTGVEETLSDAIDLRKLNEKIEARKVGEQYVLGPFESYTNSSDQPYTITVYSKDGGTLSYTLCDENGNGIGSVTGVGNVTFYISLTASEFERGVSRVTAKQGKLKVVRKYYEYWAPVTYIYQGGICTGTSTIAGKRHQNPVGPPALVPPSTRYEDIEEWTYAEIEWTDFNTIIELIKVDLDEHENGDDYEIYIDIEGTLTGPNGYSQSFKTTNGRYTFENLEPGIYYLTETINNNYGYEQNVEELIDLSVPTEGGKLCIYYMENTKYTGNLKIIKKEKDTGEAMPNISFKLKGEEGYVVGIDANGNRISQATGSVQFHNMEYTSDISQATEFITDENGEIEIYNIRIGTYTVIETAINVDEYGYELDPDYIYWSSAIGSGEQSAEGQVEVVRRKSYYTTGKEGETIPSNVPDAEFDIINFENRRKWIKLSGDVWEDMITSKTSQRDYRYSQEDDKLVANVTVRLKDRNGNTIPFKTEETFDKDAPNRGTTVDEILTDANGHYLMIDVLIDEIPNYYIEFSYNGMSYESVPVIEMLLNNEKGGTKAIENADVRAEFNRKYSEITHSGTTGPVGESRDDTGSKTYDLNYDQGEYSSSLNYGPNSVYGYDGQKFPINMTDEQYLITATTRDAYLTVAGNSGYLDDMYTPEEIRKQKIEEIKNIDLGVYEREQPDMALIEDIESVQVSLNGYVHTYNYDQRFNFTDIDTDSGFNVGVKFGNEYGSMQYTQAIYSSDVVYNQEEGGEEGLLGVYVKYKVALRNEATNLYSTINEIVNYYDTGYTVREITDEDGNPLNYTTESHNGTFDKVTIQTDQDLEPQKVKYVYITYEVENDVINNLLNEEPLLESVTEITSYSTYSDPLFSVHYAGVDKDSRPGSAEPENRETFEDDTDSAPGFLLELKEGREIRGTVWEDAAVQNLLEKGKDYTTPSGQNINLSERIGNGEYEQGTENTVGNVTVDLIVLSYQESDYTDGLGNENILGEAIDPNSSTIATLYEGNTVDSVAVGPATTTTAADGSYIFSGVIPGQYLLRFTYGDDSVIVKPGGTMEDGERIDDVDKYKSTIYRGDRPDNENTAAGDDDYWYRTETSVESAARWSDARDEIGVNKNDGKYDLLEDRLHSEERKYYYGNTTKDQEVIAAEDVLTKIEARTRGFEIKMDYDINTLNETTYEEQEQGLKCIFDNMDFGIIRRPIQRLNLDKQIAYVKVTLANGQVVIEGDPRTQEIDHLRYLPDVDEDGDGCGDVHIELDSELIQGATLTITYEIIADNTESELDYNDDNYYIFGTPADENTIIAPQPSRIVDYLSNDLAYDPDINPDWKQATQEQLEQWYKDKYFSEDAYDAIKGYNIVLYTEAFADMKIDRKVVTLEVSKLLTTDADDLTFGNDIEINELTGRRTTKEDDDDEYTIPGDYIPSEGEPGGDDDYREVTVTGPTGENQNYITYIVLGISAFIILGTGIIFIKKKVLK